MKTSALLAAMLLAACAHHQKGGMASAAPAPATPAEAKAFVADVNDHLKDLSYRTQTADWIKSTYITEDTERADSWANDAYLTYVKQTVEESRRFDSVKGIDPDSARALYLLKFSAVLPPPPSAKDQKEMTDISTKLEGMYGQGKYCGKDGKCRDLEQLSELMSKSRNYDELLDAWTGWHTVGKAMKPLYVRDVELANEGARAWNFSDVGAFWRSGYDMPPDAFAAETDRLWEQVKPLYQQLHCYVRTKLSEKYGKDKVPDHGPIPAHLLGNMWAQEWEDIYPLVTPYPKEPALDVDGALKKKNPSAEDMVKTGQSFFTSLGLSPLPDTFWKNSMFVKPRDRDVVCHASAWDVSSGGDLRVKMCIQPTQSYLETIHHELGHDYYFMQYDKLPVLFQAGANDGFHEAIGDTMILSMTPAYLQKIGLISKLPKDDKGLLNFQMRRALEGVAFLPFGKLIDEWRWEVFSGKVSPAQYNEAWWELRKKYQGVAPPVARTEEDFDPGAKYHVAANVPYMRYFLARVLQYQFHKALCDASGFKGPLHECSIFGSKAAGEKLRAMLEMGASQPWPEALNAVAGTRQIDAGPLLAYYAPLQKWLEKQNEGKTCGW